MNRHYSAEEYYTLCLKLRSAFADTALTTDIMVGFPGESLEDFEESLRFAQKVGFEKVHVFPYSVRPGTPAAKMQEQVDKHEKERRTAQMIEATEKIRRQYLENQIGKTLDILVEEHHDGFAQGYTANYTPVKIITDERLHGIAKAKITAVDGDFCVGEITE